MSDEHQQILRKIVETGTMDPHLSSVRVKPFCEAYPKGTTEQDIKQALWSSEFLDFVLAQDDDPHNLPWGGCFYFKGYLYPIPKGMDHSQVSNEIDSWTADDIKRIFKNE